MNHNLRMGNLFAEYTRYLVSSDDVLFLSSSGLVSPLSQDVYFSYPTRPHAQVLGGMTVEVGSMRRRGKVHCSSRKAISARVPDTWYQPLLDTFGWLML